VQGAEEARNTLLSRSSLSERVLPDAVREVTRRVFGAELDAADVVERILRDVKENGDAAVRRYNREIDGAAENASRAALKVSREEIEQAYGKTEKPLVNALRQAADRIRIFHELQLANSLRPFQNGAVGQVVRPLARAGFYVPGTSAIYPSTVLMSVIPARVAGVGEVLMCTPVDANGDVAALKLVAADIAGVDRVFKAGGVQGIAAMAFGTETIPRVDKICGPGNIFVTLAKKQLFGQVGIDGIFGPSETVVVADARAEAALVAADLLAGAEHDELASAILLTDSEALAAKVAELVDAGIGSLERASVAGTSMEAHGGVIIVDSIDGAIDLANEFAPEHLCLHLSNADEVMQQVKNAGCVFVGANSVESIGDYTAGPSHVMPTGGSAAYASPLGVQDFLRLMSVVRLDKDTVNAIGPAAAAIAHAEGLTGHARAVEHRLRQEPP
jgi:histidinol dehydrogenase